MFAFPSSKLRTARSRRQTKNQRVQKARRLFMERLDPRIVLAGVGLDVGASTMSIAQFEQNLLEQAAPGGSLAVVGYSYFLSKREDGFPHEGVVAFDGVGEARTANDAPQLDRTVATRQAVASVSKPFTSAAVMQIIQNQTLDANGDFDAAAFDIQLERTLDEFIPPSWDGASWLGNVTIRELLTHASGFGEYEDTLPGQGDGAARTRAQVKALLEDENYAPFVTPANNNNYTSSNYSVLAQVIPRLWDGVDNSILDDVDGGDSSAVFDLPEAMQDAIAEDFDLDTITEPQLSAALYKYYTATFVMEPAGIIAPNTINLGDDGEPGTGDETLAYTSAAANGVDTGDRTLRGGALGWNLSVIDLDEFLSVLRYTEDILMEETRDKMLDENLAWRTTSATPYGLAFGHNGGNTGGRINTLMMNFPDNVQASMTINSRLGAGFGSEFTVDSSDTNITNAVLNAYNNAWTDVVYDGFTFDEAPVNVFTLQLNPVNSDWIDLFHNGSTVLTRRIDTLDSLTINGLGGANTYNIFALPSSLQLNINGGDMTDTVNIGDILNDLDEDTPGGLSFDGAGGFDQLIVEDGNEDQNGRIYGISNANVTRSFGANPALQYDFENVESVILNASDFDDIVNVVTTTAVPFIVVNGRDGDDTISGGAGDDVLNGEDGNDVVSGGGGDDTINGGSGFDTLDGQGGNDTINGQGDNDTINGGTGDDTINGGSGNDIIHGEEGRDTIDGSIGNDLISGGGGDDVLNGGYDNDTITGGSGNDTINGDDGSDTIEGGGGADEIFGGEGDDTIRGGAGADSIFGGEGDDDIRGGSGADDIFGGEGDDTLRGEGGRDSILGQKGDDTIEGGDDADFISGADGDDLIFGGDGDDEIYAGNNNDNVSGGKGNDLIEGGYGADILFGDQGADQLIGGLISLSPSQRPDESADWLDGGAGDDAIAGDNANLSFTDFNVSTAGGGNDLILGGGGNDLIFGQDGDDRIQGNSGDDSIFAMAGNDIAFGGSIVCNIRTNPNGPPRDRDGDGESDNPNPTNPPTKPVPREFDGCFDEFRTPRDPRDRDPNEPSTIAGSPTIADGSDAIQLGAGDDLGYGDNWSLQFMQFTLGGAGDDIQGGAGVDVVFGQVGADTIGGGEEDDTLIGGQEDDQLSGELGNDWIAGDGGNDTLTGGWGNDTLYGGSDDDLLVGQSGADLLFGYTGNDRLIGGNQGLNGIRDLSDDSLFGGEGDDGLIGDNGTFFPLNVSGSQGGDDLIDAGAGDDVAFGQAGNDSILGGPGSDALYGQRGDDDIFGGQGNDFLNGGAGDDELKGADGDDTLRGGRGDDLIDAGAGDDLVFGQAGDDTILGGPGSDALYGQRGDDDISGGQGNDVVNGASGDDLLRGDDDDDFLAGGPGNDLMLGGNGDDLLLGNKGNDSIDGGFGDDILLGGSDNDTLRGRNGNDLMIGGRGNDILVGGFGDDSMYGGRGRDLLIGGVGADLLSGGGQDDILINGRTMYDNNDVALRAIMAEWTSNRTYAERVQNLSNMPNPSFLNRLNGSVFLIMNATVFDDLDADLFSGEGGLDWFFADEFLDTILDLSGGEVVF